MQEVQIAWDQEDVAYAVEFDYDAIDRSLGAQPEPQVSRTTLVEGVRKLLQWIRNGANARAKEIRLQAAYYFVNPKDQVQLAREIGVTKATISQKAVELRDYFQIKTPTAAASSMRGEVTRRKQAEICKLNHKRRKNGASKPIASQTKLERDTWKPPTLKEIASRRAEQRSSQPTNAVSSSTERKTSLDTENSDHGLTSTSAGK